MADIYRIPNAEAVAAHPVLVLEDGSGLAESGIIVEYLEDKFDTGIAAAICGSCARMRFIVQVVWHEMEDGLKGFMAARPADKATQPV